METKTIVSKQGTLQGRDITRGAIFSAISTVLYAVGEALLAAITNGGIESIFEKETLLRIGTVAVTTLIGYLLKNAGEKSKVITIRPLREDEA